MRNIFITNIKTIYDDYVINEERKKITIVKGLKIDFIINRTIECSIEIKTDKALSNTDIIEYINSKLD